MDIKSWVKSVAVAKVVKALNLYGLKTEKQTNQTIHGDIIATWDRSKKGYLVHIIPILKRADIEDQSFKNTLEFCSKNKLRLVIIAWEHENRLYDFTMDLDDGESLPFKLIKYERMEQLVKEFEEISK